MRDWKGKRYWIVGASEGLGRALAHQLSRTGCELILSARSPERLKELREELPGRSTILPVDVTDDAAMSAAGKTAGDIDGMVYLAGVYWPMKAQEWNSDRAVEMIDVNLSGAMRAVGAVLPGMRERGRGHIVLTGSLSGFRGLPGAAAYGASKAGIMYLAEALDSDLRDTPVRIQLVNPGFVRTRLTQKNDFSMPFIMEPEEAAREIFEHMSGDSFARSFPAAFSWLFRAGRGVPRFVHHRIFRN